MGYSCKIQEILKCSLIKIVFKNRFIIFQFIKTNPPFFLKIFNNLIAGQFLGVCPVSNKKPLEQA